VEPPKIGDGVSGFSVGGLKAALASAVSLARTLTVRARTGAALAATPRALLRTAARALQPVRAITAAAVWGCCRQWLSENAA
jgi:hypothetical protein